MGRTVLITGGSRGIGRATSQLLVQMGHAVVGVYRSRRDAAQSLEAAERSLVLSTKRYQEGYSDFQRVLTAQRARAAASSSYVQNQGAHIAAVIDFYKALGGGWKPATTEDLLPPDVRQVMAERTDWGGLLEEPVPEPDGNNEDSESTDDE